MQKLTAHAPSCPITLDPGSATIATTTLPGPPTTKGLFLAPTIVGESLKGAFLLSEVFGGTFGLPTNPPPPPSPPHSSGNLAVVNGNAAKDPADVETLGPGDVSGEKGAGGRGGVGGRTDIVQALELGDRDRLVKFCEAVQLFSPVNAYVRPGEHLRARASAAVV